MQKPASAADYAGMFAVTAIIFALILVIFHSLTAALVAPGVILAFMVGNIGDHDDEFAATMFSLAAAMVLVGAIGGYASWW